MFRTDLFVLVLFTLTILHNSSLLTQTTTITPTTCPPLVERKGIKVKCREPNSTLSMNCYNSRIPIGTVAEYICDDYYSMLESYEDPPDHKLKCNENTKWTGLGMFNAFSCQPECGTRRGLENEKFLIGGSTTSAEKWPWHATIFIARDKQFTYQCGGTLVNAFREGFIILTAAHCLLDDFDVILNPNQLRVVLGGQKSDLTENKNDFNAQVFSVRDVIIHGGYIGERALHQNDIGILKLEGSIHITNTVSPVCLSANNDLAAQQLKMGSMGEVVGFGRYTNEAGKIVEPSPILRQASLPIADNDGCYQWQKYHLDNSQICAGYLNELSVCKGDSGGGYVFPRQNGDGSRYYLQGIVSYGYVRNETFCENYGVFTKVHHHMNWIQDQMAPKVTPVPIDQLESEDSDSSDSTELHLWKCPICPSPKSIETLCPPIAPKAVVLHPNNETLTNDTIPIPADVNTTNSSILTTTQKTPFSKSTAPSPFVENTKIVFPTLNHISPLIDVTESPSPRNDFSTKDKETWPTWATDTNGLQLFSSFELGGHTEYRNLALNLHNNFRIRHGVPLLRLNDSLSAEALAYAHKLIRENKFVNEYPIGENPPSYNKNIFQLTETGVKTPTPAVEVVRQAVNYWYSEMNKYNWNNPGTTTFSQVVWKSTLELGIGVAVGHQGNTFRQVVVAAYSPPGNMLGGNYFRTNVFPPQHSQSRLRRRSS